ncbi:MerR family DNA-binding transcriptional regulator [Paenactinomyces guangxiensis]|uniref:MerR family DNA-binding transcriptional regulator n=1 Tax=Paenactinomyces guangxiensis TaxID=1490290 RepID=A0A7W2AB73_9BACL|nr:MerR family DNA-binding transcriptional regulator [Paenactinomyces guangxiensis]MBH8593712.1 MerR family DNA-binding transcriptional regulator [Paenactinomyces guangxiensis]
MNIGEISCRTGVSVRSIRYYEQKGLISPKRQENGYREYGEKRYKNTFKRYNFMNCERGDSPIHWRR